MSFKLNPLLNEDAYKLSHINMYPKGVSEVYSNFTPRSVRHLNVPSQYKTNEIVWFGGQAVIQDMVDLWNEHFFSLSDIDIGGALDEFISDFSRIIAPFAGADYSVKHLYALHAVGYLPLEIKTLPEGSHVPVGVPVLTVRNTKPEFYWLTNFIESYLSAELWKMSTSATIADYYRQIGNFWYYKTGANKAFLDFAFHDFSYRGMSGSMDAIKSGSAHLTSFKGTDTVPAIPYLEYHYSGKDTFIGASVPACYDSKTEILTSTGWKYFKDLIGSDKVAQFDNGKISFVTPTGYYDKPYKGNMVKFTSGTFNYVDLLVTPNHKMLKYDYKNGYKLFEAQNTEYNTKNYAVVSGYIDKHGDTLSAIDKLKIAFQADGSFPSHADDYDGSRGGEFPIRFSFKKDRKAERLDELIQQAGVVATKTKYESGYYSYWINMPYEMSKDLSWVNLNNLTIESAIEFVNELQYWDGKTIPNKNSMGYSSTEKINVDVIQAICSISGFKTKYSTYLDARGDRKLIHSLNILPNKIIIGARNISSELVEYDDNVYCVSVPSKVLVVRRNGIVSICGNTEHSIQTAFVENDLEYFNFILDTYPTGIVSIVADGYDYWSVLTNVLPQLKDKIMNREPDAMGFAKTIIRPDSGDPVRIIAGYKYGVYSSLNQAKEDSHGIRDAGYEVIITSFGKVYSVNLVEEDTFDGLRTHVYFKESELTLEEVKGSIQVLWELFGGTTNEKGYKTLDQHIGLIYGDSITLERADEILRRLEAKGFSADNVVFGIGSYTYQYNTRDTLGFAMKATNIVLNGVDVPLFKDPKTDDGTKKSAKGLLSVTGLVIDDKTTYALSNNVSREIESGTINALTTLFKDGEFIKHDTLEEIRNRISQG